MATNDKYDRQIRLWGASGQRLLGGASILLVGASAAGTETAKNLVLPGVGSVHVVDDAAAHAGDANFFVLPADAGRSRADAARDSLAETNPDVRCTSAREHDLSSLPDRRWRELATG
eukprot:CAMPEP_0194318542 /NCGR_PEP_ID=MMETSP0171-20130528/15131_1 /TAXON_ID=218684 /ORGANISM="Corethron pennatum, Strain L29A3" /LENGTH=116 /DNA_ID=CAMNT_0039075475 /DNA_START=68 /DNA_END=414 /DNA_ORIENTATION=-